MVKDFLNGWNLLQKAKNCKFNLRSFSGAKADCVNDYDKPALRENSDHLIIHIGTNDVIVEGKSPKVVADS